jgi:hypothetical protein
MCCSKIQGTFQNNYNFIFYNLLNGSQKAFGSEKEHVYEKGRRSTQVLKEVR